MQISNLKGRPAGIPGGLPGPRGEDRRGSRGRLRVLLGTLLAGIGLLASACGAGSLPPPISHREFAEAQTFPFFTVYWVGRSFHGYPLTAADGRMTYNPAFGDGVYYGGCLSTGKLLPQSGCVLPLQVTTLIYRRHPNEGLGRQRNTIVRGVPATIYNEGRSLVLYSGRLEIEVFGKNLSYVMQAARLLRPLNTRGSNSRKLPEPVYCPWLSGPETAAVRAALASLPRDVCRRTAEAEAAEERMQREKGAIPG